MRKVYNTEKTITEKGLTNSSTKLLNEGQIIISARGTVGELEALIMLNIILVLPTKKVLKIVAFFLHVSSKNQ